MRPPPSGQNETDSDRRDYDVVILYTLLLVISRSIRRATDGRKWRKNLHGENPRGLP